MLRRIAAVILALTLNPAVVGAQDTVLTVTVQAADLHTGPSNVTPVIAHVARGTALPVSRNLGSWARVPWPDAPDGVAYVHVTMGRMGPSNGDAAAANISPRTSSAPALPSTSAETPMPPAPRRPSTEGVAVRGDSTDTPISRLFGVGGLVGSRHSFGATARAWRSNRFGIQLEVTRDATTSDVAAGRVTSVRFEPGVVYALFDHVTDYVWFRPYVGSVVSFGRQTLKISAPVAPAPASHNGVGLRVFGGSELTFAGVPQFGLSAEFGYRRFPTPFPEFEADRLSVSIAGHWYIK
jgi:hypothetical protein